MISRVAKTISSLNKNEKRAYTLITINLFAISFLAAFAVRPSIKIVAEYEKKYKSALDIDEQLTTKIINLNTAKKNLENNYENIMAVNKLMPKEPTQNKLLKELSYSATKNNDTLTGAKFNQTTSTGDTKETSLILEVAGSYENIRGFIESIEKAERLIKIESVLITRDDQKKITNAVINCKIYYLEQDV